MLDSTTDHKRLQRRARQARYKARQRACVTVWPIEIDAAPYTKLVRLGYLNAGTTDAREGGRAVEQLLDNIQLPFK